MPSNFERLNNTSDKSQVRPKSSEDSNARLARLRAEHGLDKVRVNYENPDTPRLLGGSGGGDPYGKDFYKPFLDYRGINTPEEARAFLNHPHNAQAIDEAPALREALNDIIRGEGQAGPSHQREVSYQEKENILNNLDLTKVKKRIASAKYAKFSVFKEDSHFITNYRLISRYTNHKERSLLDSAYEGYNNIKMSYNANPNCYNSWEIRCCQAMGIPKEEQ